MKHLIHRPIHNSLTTIPATITAKASNHKKMFADFVTVEVSLQVLIAPLTQTLLLKF